MRLCLLADDLEAIASFSLPPTLGLDAKGAASGSNSSSSSSAAAAAAPGSPGRSARALAAAAAASSGARRIAEDRAVPESAADVWPALFDADLIGHLAATPLDSITGGTRTVCVYVTC